METLESSRVCRLCGKESGISIDIFDKKESHVKKINAVLPILVHEMDMLPKHMCHRCSYKLEEFHKFYVDCLKTDADFKSQLSWMRKGDSTEEVGVPMVQIENINIKTEPPNYDIYELDPIVDNVNYINSMRSVTFPVNNVHNRTVIPCTVDDTEKRCGFAYSTFSNYAHCKCACDKSNRTKEAVLKDCTKMRCRYSINKNLGTTDVDDTVPTINTKNSSILDNILQETRRKDDLLETSIDAFNGHPSKNTRKQSYITTKDILFPSTDDITDLCSNRNRESKGDVRILRPRKRSVDYIGTKKKSSSTSRMNTQSRARSADTKQAVSSETHDINFVKVKEERVDNFEGRTLRPRKNSIDYMGTKRKHSSQSGVNSIDRSKSEECHSKRYRSCGGNAGTPNSIGCMGGKQDTSTEAVDRLVKKEIFADEEYPTPTHVTNAKVQLETRKRHYVKNLSNHFDELSKDITIKVEKDDTDCRTRNSKSSKKNSSFVAKSKSLIKVTKNKLKSSRATVKRTPNKTVCYSPKYLRSHDVHLRNGKVKNLEPSDRRIRKNLKKELWRFVAQKEIIKTVKVPASRKSFDSIKQFCEKCSLSFVNKEVFRLHACYYD